MSNTTLRNVAALPGTKALLLSELTVDHRVQRDLNPNWAETLAHTFDPGKMGVIHVSERADGTHAIVDGQHRVEAAKQYLGENYNGQRVDCKVYRGLTLAQEAALFVHLNRVLRPQPLDIYFNKLQAGDPTIVAIDRIVREQGFKVARKGTDGQITACASLENVYHGFAQSKKGEWPAPKPELLRVVLATIHAAWGGAYASLNGHIIEGLGRVLATRGTLVNIEVLTHKLASFSGAGAGLIGKARGRRSIMGGTLSLNVAEEIIAAYNSHKKVARLDPLR